ncbi:hypothetical protein [Endozoicomonas sp. YOMI1]|uniref:hypothetical protein n=1 Tax=Endozoicomonas sp. YOMI1 TaxID=2828739 RepID=UPI002149002E|nr:hypothetical protein [Endozoicomonas sp. YOMI1]
MSQSLLEQNLLHKENTAEVLVAHNKECMEVAEQTGNLKRKRLVVVGSTQAFEHLIVLQYNFYYDGKNTQSNPRQAQQQRHLQQQSQQRDWQNKRQPDPQAPLRLTRLYPLPPERFGTVSNASSDQRYFHYLAGYDGNQPLLMPQQSSLFVPV